MHKLNCSRSNYSLEFKSNTKPPVLQAKCANAESAGECFHKAKDENVSDKCI